MGPKDVWGPHGIKGWWTGLKGQPHHLATKAHAAKGQGAQRGANPKGCLGEQGSPWPPALEGFWGAPPFPPPPIKGGGVRHT